MRKIMILFFLPALFYMLDFTEWTSIYVFAQETLKGSVGVERMAEPVEDYFEGEVKDGNTGNPIQGATVSIPDKGFLMKTNEHGAYRIPRFLGKNPLIMSVTQPGYAPFSMTITENAPPFFTVKLKKVQQMLILDSQLRHLGDGSFSTASSNAFNFKKSSDGPAIRIPFSLKGIVVSEAPYLQIGSIIGLDTSMVHFLTSNNMGSSASPLLIRVNGTVIAQIQVNGDNQKIQLPLNLLNQTGVNIIEIETGHHFPEPYRIDYDDMEFMHLVLYP